MSSAVCLTIHDRKYGSISIFNAVKKSFKNDISKKRYLLILGHLVVFCFLAHACHASNSMAILNLCLLQLFHVFILFLPGLDLKDNCNKDVFTFGLSRLEVLCLFGSLILLKIGCFFILKEAFEAVFHSYVVKLHSEFLVWVFVSCALQHISIQASRNDYSFRYVINQVSTSWVQQQTNDLLRLVFSIMPFLPSNIPPRINPFSLLTSISFLTLLSQYVIISVYSYHSIDCIFAIFLTFTIFTSIFPLVSFTGQILLQTTPSHVVGQIEKNLRETLTFDGVLEIKSEHFWSISFGKLTGSLQIRVRRDVDQQAILTKISQHLNPILPSLTIQLIKDDFWFTKSSSSYLPPSSTSYLPSSSFH